MNRVGIFILSTLFFASCSKPTASFLFEQGRKDAPSKIKFVNQSQHAESYIWDMGDGTEIEGESAEHRYKLSGKYDVKLTAIKGDKKSTTTQEIIILPPKDCLVEIETNHGTMIAKLYEETPLHRENFLKLVDKGFYDGLIFHRVIENFMIQGGDPNSKGEEKKAVIGSGGPGYQVVSEIKENLIHKKGALAAAREPDEVNPMKKSNGSQFYIVHGKALSEIELERLERKNGVSYTKEIKEVYQRLGGFPTLDYEYTVFGEVIEGMNVIDKIATIKTDGANRPLEDVNMKVTLIN